MPLSDQPARIDYLLLRKLTAEGEALDESAETLRRLWPLLPRVSVVEYKSPSHPYRFGHLDRLWGYVHTYFANECALPRRRTASGKGLAAPAPSEAGDGTASPTDTGGPEVLERGELCAVLVVPRRTPSLDADVASMGLSWKDLGSGYWQVDGGLFVLYVVEIDVVAPAEGDDLLHSLGHGKLATPAARWFWTELMGSKDVVMEAQDMEGYEELLLKLLDTVPPAHVIEHYNAEQRLAGLPAEQRLEGLDRDHQALALPVEVVRLLPDGYLISLSPETQAELRRRIARSGNRD